MLERQPKQKYDILQHAALVINTKIAQDIARDERRAQICGCRGCHHDAQKTREFYLDLKSVKYQGAKQIPISHNYY